LAWPVLPTRFSKRAFCPNDSSLDREGMHRLNKCRNSTISKQSDMSRNKALEIHVSSSGTSRLKRSNPSDLNRLVIRFPIDDPPGNDDSFQNHPRGIPRNICWTGNCFGKSRISHHIRTGVAWLDCLTSLSMKRNRALGNNRLLRLQELGA